MVALVRKGDVRLCDSRFFRFKTLSLRRKKGCQRWHTTECLLEADVVKRAKYDMGNPKNDSRSNTYQRNAMKLSVPCAPVQCGSMEAQALGFLLHTAGCERHHL